MSKKEAYKDKMKARLDEFNAEIKKLQAKADRANAEARIEQQEQIDRLRARQRAVREKLDELDDSAEGAWEDMKVGVESAWDSLRAAASSARARFD